MASNYTTTKTELIAIYRLEFYKNKRNWKLRRDGRREPPRSPCAEFISKLNKTYNVEPDIEPESDAEQISPHNKAFLHEEPDDASNIQAPPDPEPVQQQYHAWAEQQQWSEAVWQDDEQEWCGAEAEGVPEDVAYPDECDGPCHQYHQHQHIWQPVNQYEQLKSQCEPIEQQLEYFSPAELVQTADEWLQNNGYPNLQEECAPYYEQYALMDNSADFVRGAHGAPHSSEIDLSVTHDECGCMSSRPLSQLPRRQLVRAVQRHAAALRGLLGEQAIRDKLYSQTPPAPPLHLEEPPTRDTDPPLAPDLLLGGGEGRGRGRGRLIGIDMGRPYRL